MMFAAGAFGASWLWLLALVVARYYGTWRRYQGWAEIGADFTRLTRAVGRLGAGQPQSYGSALTVGGAVGAMLGWFGAWAMIAYALSR